MRISFPVEPGNPGLLSADTAGGAAILSSGGIRQDYAQALFGSAVSSMARLNDSTTGTPPIL
jgi:hypothetical protein